MMDLTRFGIVFPLSLPALFFFQILMDASLLQTFSTNAFGGE